MMDWLPFATYCVFTALAFRITLLRELTLLRKTEDACIFCRDNKPHVSGQPCRVCERGDEVISHMTMSNVAFVTTLTTIFWPIVALYYMVKFVLFPRGVVTKYERLRRREMKALESERRTEALAKEYGLTVVEGTLDAASRLP